MSDWLPWVALAVYVAGFAVTARVIYAATDFGSPEDRLLAVAGGLLWPLLAAALAVWGLATLPTRGVTTAYERRAELWAAERARAAVKARAAELEAENERLRKEAGR